MPGKEKPLNKILKVRITDVFSLFFNENIIPTQEKKITSSIGKFLLISSLLYV